jgi:hypothetical protein
VHLLQTCIMLTMPRYSIQLALIPLHVSKQRYCPIHWKTALTENIGGNRCEALSRVKWLSAVCKWWNVVATKRGHLLSEMMIKFDNELLRRISDRKRERERECVCVCVCIRWTAKIIWWLVLTQWWNEGWDRHTGMQYAWWKRRKAYSVLVGKQTPMEVTQSGRWTRYRR